MNIPLAPAEGVPEPQRPQVPLGEALVRHLGWNDEPTWEAIAQFEQEGAQQTLRMASMLAAQACISTVKGHESFGNDTLGFVQNRLNDLMRAGDRWSRATRPDARKLSLLMRFIEDRDNPEATDRHRATLYGQSIATIAQASDVVRLHDIKNAKQLDDETGKAIGTLALETTLTLLNYECPPDVMAVPALHHHNKAQLHVRGSQEPLSAKGRYTSRDILLIQSSLTDDHFRITPVQVKAECLGLCADFEDNDPVYVNRVRGKNERARSLYNREIILTSGQCDDGMRYKPGTEPKLPIADMLLRDARGESSEEDKQWLQYYRELLLYNLTVDNQHRRGTAPPPEVPEYLGNWPEA